MSTSRDGREPLANVRDRVQASVVGRERELGLVLAAVAAGRDILLEGPPGTSKSTLLRAITAEWGIPLVFVEGNADLTPAKLVGHHNPSRVLREDYSPENFVDGPLIEAMRGGGFLYIEEFNRAPEDTLNTLLTAMAERRIAVPRVGEVIARDTFRVIASMNPYDNIGTTRLSTSVHDRLCRLAITYQDAAAERGIVALRAPRFDQALADLKPAVYERLVADAVAVTRATREHEDIRQGSSVRGAIDLTLVAGELFLLDSERGRGSAGWAHDTDGGAADPPAASDGAAAVAAAAGAADTEAAMPAREPLPAGEPLSAQATASAEEAEQRYRETVYDAMIVALSGRIFLDETVESTPEQVLRQIWEDHFILAPATAAPG
jgi:MoxR-like ATPase